MIAIMKLIRPLVQKKNPTIYNLNYKIVKEKIKERGQINFKNIYMDSSSCTKNKYASSQNLEALILILKSGYLF